MSPADLIIKPRWILPIEPEDLVLEDHCLTVANGRISGLYPVAELPTEAGDAEVVILDDHALMPGLVNGHTHAAMCLMRGFADDLPLMRWLEERVWPVEREQMSPQFVADGTLLAVVEMLRSGTTCFNDMYFFPDVAAGVAIDSGIRACLGMIALDFPSVWAGSGEEYLAKGLATRAEFEGEKTLSFAFAPHAPYTVGDELLRRIRDLSERFDCPIHIHVHETAGEVRDALETTGRRPLARLEALGLLNAHLLAVHMTQLETEEIERLAVEGVNVAHCPESNLKLASGIARLADLDAHGVNCCIGTDGAASNDDLNMLSELRTAALLAKGSAKDAAAVPAARALSMATLNGARALGLDQETGSLKVGKWADLVAINLNVPETWPVYDPIAQIVYAAGREQVTDVWVAGRRLLADRCLTRTDEDELRERILHWQKKLISR